MPPPHTTTQRFLKSFRDLIVHRFCRERAILTKTLIVTVLSLSFGYLVITVSLLYRFKFCSKVHKNAPKCSISRKNKTKIFRDPAQNFPDTPSPHLTPSTPSAAFGHLCRLALDALGISTLLPPPSTKS